VSNAAPSRVFEFAGWVRPGRLSAAGLCNAGTRKETVQDDDRFRREDDQGKRPWFGPKRFGGYGQQSWQGYLIAVLLVLFVAVIATASTGHSPSPRS
jgi:hypothetical protein